MDIDYTAADLDPQNFPFIPSSNIVREDVLQLSFPDASFDLVLHNHVIEHVEDDMACLRESMRVLRKGGVCIFSFPYFPDRASLFDATVTDPEDRKRLYGWHDHLRRYGHDFLDHFHEHDFFPEILFRSGLPCSEFTQDERMRMKLDAHAPADCILCLTKS
nr:MULTISPECIES: class I SAM-dependent methyltransferase [unclassified Desulfovibrio]